MFFTLLPTEAAVCEGGKVAADGERERAAVFSRDAFWAAEASAARKKSPGRGAGGLGAGASIPSWPSEIKTRVPSLCPLYARARRSRAAGRIRPELWTAAPADFFLGNWLAAAF